VAALCYDNFHLAGIDRLDSLGSNDTLGVVMKSCPRCGRNHSGICGIPPGVTLGFGARVGGTTIGAAAPQPQTRKRASPKEAAIKVRSKQRLRSMLEWGEEEKRKVLAMLKVMPPEMVEYDQLLDRLTKLEETLRQIRLRLEG